MNAFGSIATVLALVLGVGSGTSAHAETVFVKYRGPVNLAQFHCDYPISSFVHRICYRKEKQYLVVLLERTYYHYCRIPPMLVQQWLDASSQGRFYGTYIKGNYDCRLGGIPVE